MYYHLWLIWLRDREMFDRYQTAVAPVAARYGGIERSFTPLEVYGEGVALPDMVNVVHTAGERSLAALGAPTRSSRRWCRCVPTRYHPQSSIRSMAPSWPVADNDLARLGR